MIRYIRITEETLQWFSPLLPQKEEENLKNGKGIYAIGAAWGKRACGILVFQIVQGIIDIRYLAVSEEYRRKGIATGMAGYLCQHAWPTATPVTCTFSAAGFEDPLYLFFISMANFSVAKEEGIFCRVPLASLVENPLLVALRGRKLNHPAFFSLSRKEQERCFSQMRQQDSFLLDEVSEKEYCKPLCLCEMEGEKIKAAVFVVCTEEGGVDLELAYAWCAQGWQKTLIELLAQASERIPKDAEGYLYISAITPASEAIVEKMLPERETLGGYYRAVWDMEL